MDLERASMPKRVTHGDPIGQLPARVSLIADDATSIYLDGNSLGRLPLATRDRLRERGRRGVGRRADPRLGHAGSTWPRQAGDVLAAACWTARPGRGDRRPTRPASTCTSWPPRRWTRGPAGGVIVTDDDNFPTDRYVLAGLAAGARA